MSTPLRRLLCPLRRWTVLLVLASLAACPDGGSQLLPPVPGSGGNYVVWRDATGAFVGAGSATYIDANGYVWDVDEPSGWLVVDHPGLSLFFVPNLIYASGDCSGPAFVSVPFGGLLVPPLPAPPARTPFRVANDTALHVIPDTATITQDFSAGSFDDGLGGGCTMSSFTADAVPLSQTIPGAAITRPPDFVGPLHPELARKGDPPPPVWKDASGALVGAATRPRFTDEFIDANGYLWDVDVGSGRLTQVPGGPFWIFEAALLYASTDCSGTPYVSLQTIGNTVTIIVHSVSGARVPFKVVGDGTWHVLPDNPPVTANFPVNSYDEGLGCSMASDFMDAVPLSATVPGAAIVPPADFAGPLHLVKAGASDPLPPQWHEPGGTQVGPAGGGYIDAKGYVWTVDRGTGSIYVPSADPLFSSSPALAYTDGSCSGPPYVSLIFPDFFGGTVILPTPAARVPFLIPYDLALHVLPDRPTVAHDLAVGSYDDGSWGCIGGAAVIDGVLLAATVPARPIVPPANFTGPLHPVVP